METVKTMTKHQLVQTAQWHENDDVANAAMARLRAEFDATYFFCHDCDGLVCKAVDCCLNQIEKL